ncbi:MAG: hypothetical protein QOI23_803, partial [Chloroflexota bacterium]|nr:hypothetical protein [Chloroflexota bacterium]
MAAGAEGLGTGDGAWEGEGGGDGEGAADGEAVGTSLGEAVGDGVAEGVPGVPGVQPSVPLRKISCAWAPQPCTMPAGWLYQSCIVGGKALMKRAMMVEPTLSPNAVISPPPPFGAVLPTQTPTTTLGLYAMIHESGIPPFPLSLVPVLLAIWRF